MSEMPLSEVIAPSVDSPMAHMLAEVGAASGHVPTPLELLAERAGEDPFMQIVAQLLTRQLTSEHAEIADPEEPDSSEGREDLDSESSRIERRRMLGRVTQELEELRRRNDALADVLGACGYCWGGSLGCDLCRGAGRPGWTTPNMELFSRYIAPAVRAIRARSRGAKVRFQHEAADDLLQVSDTRKDEC